MKLLPPGTGSEARYAPRKGFSISLHKARELIVYLR